MTIEPHRCHLLEMRATRPGERWDGFAPCGIHGADYRGQECTICEPLDEIDATARHLAEMRAARGGR